MFSDVFCSTVGMAGCQESQRGIWTSSQQELDLHWFLWRAVLTFIFCHNKRNLWEASRCTLLQQHTERGVNSEGRVDRYWSFSTVHSRHRLICAKKCVCSPFRNRMKTRSRKWRRGKRRKRAAWKRRTQRRIKYLNKGESLDWLYDLLCKLLEFYFRMKRVSWVFLLPEKSWIKRIAKASSSSGSKPLKLK